MSSQSVSQSVSESVGRQTNERTCVSFKHQYQYQQLQLILISVLSLSTNTLLPSQTKLLDSLSVSVRPLHLLQQLLLFFHLLSHTRFFFFLHYIVQPVDSVSEVSRTCVIISLCVCIVFVSVCWTNTWSRREKIKIYWSVKILFIFFSLFSLNSNDFSLRDPFFRISTQFSAHYFEWTNEKSPL